MFQASTQLFSSAQTTKNMSHSKNLKRKRFDQPEEITFDFSARQDYLTGFHKRKLERAKHAQDISIRKEKEVKLETRRQVSPQNLLDYRSTNELKSLEQSARQNLRDMSNPWTK